jgi:cytochrome c-type biogenesis protein CcmH
VKRVLAVIAVMSSLLASGAIVQRGPAAIDTDAEARLQVFLREIRCLVCQNETLAESRAELAVDLRNEVRAQMQAGRSDAEIREFLTARYGDFVLYRPPVKPSTYLLWFGPFALLGAGLFALRRAIRRTVSTAPVPLATGELRRARGLLNLVNTGEPS